MLYGQAVKQDVKIIRSNPVGASPLEFESTTQDCCVILPVFAEEVLTNNYYNDNTSPLFFWNNAITTADLYLQKKVNGSWTDVANLLLSTWGVPYAFGFFTNIYNEKAIGCAVQWKLVLNDVSLGEGNYRIRSTGTLLIGGTFTTKYSFEYCLKKYTPDRADNTVRISWWTNGQIGDPEDDRLKIDFGIINWFNQIRLPDAVFGYDTSTYEREFVRYQNGQQKWLQDIQVEEYLLKSGRYDNALHRFIKIMILQADEIKITDYSIDNPVNHQDRNVIPASNYEPIWTFGSMLSPVEIKFQQAYQNHIHKRK